MAEIRRDFRVDVLRGLSILSVLVLHFNLAYRLLKGPLGPWLPGPYLSNLVWNGNYGVTVFFVISGYLITSTSLRRFGSVRQVTPRVFYAFRFARIMPCLMLVLAVITGLGQAGMHVFQSDPPTTIWMADLSILTFWHNVMMAWYGYFNYSLNIFWSLSVEEVFYLAFPLLCLVLRRVRWMMVVWGLAIVAGPIYRSLHSHNEIEFLYGYLACFDAIAMGCMAAVLVWSGRVPLVSARMRNLVQGLALVFMGWIFMRAGIDAVPVWGMTFMALGAAVFVSVEGAEREVAQGRAFADRLAAPVAWLGRHSYELYLFHIVLLSLMRTALLPETMAPGAKLPWLVVFLAASAAVAWGIARMYSEPMNRWLRERLAGRVAEGKLVASPR